MGIGLESIDERRKKLDMTVKELADGAGLDYTRTWRAMRSQLTPQEIKKLEMVLRVAEEERGQLFVNTNAVIPQ